MTRKIKNLGLAIVAVAAMSMAAAASVQASELHVTHQGSATITGQQTEQHVFTTTAGTVTCATADFEGTVQGQGPQITAQELQTTATYSGCKAFGLDAQVRMNGCKYTITNTLNTGAEPKQTFAKTAWVDITGCTAGKKIEVIAVGGACTATVGEQHHLSHLVFADAGPPNQKEEDVEVQVTVTAITYQLDGVFCPGGSGTKTNGTYQGKATFKAFKDTGITKDVIQHNHKFDQSTHINEQVGLRST